MWAENLAHELYLTLPGVRRQSMDAKKPRAGKPGGAKSAGLWEEDCPLVSP